MTSSDEDQIRALVATWMTATQAGDLDTLLSLMTEDVVFLVPGRAPMGKQDFAAAAHAQCAASAPKFQGHAEIEEVVVDREWAFMRSRLRVVLTPPEGAATVRAGHTLTIFRREGGAWRLARDANLLAPVPPPDAATATERIS